jgi:hypothetical protein
MCRTAFPAEESGSLVRNVISGALAGMRIEADFHKEGQKSEIVIAPTDADGNPLAAMKPVKATSEQEKPLMLEKPLPPGSYRLRVHLSHADLYAIWPIHTADAVN